MALSLARSPSPSPGAAQVAHFALPLLPLRSPRRQYQALRLRLRVAASSPPEAQAAAPFAEEGEEQGEKRRKLYVANLPWSFPAPEIEKLFAQHGIVKDVEVIKGKDGRNRGFAFVTMSTAEEAAAAAEKLNSHDVMGRTIKVEFSKSFRKPAPLPPPGTIIERHKLYVSNLPWKARAPNVKEFFANFNPLSANVIFDNGKAAGYGFVSFGTKEAEDVMGRTIKVEFSKSFRKPAPLPPPGTIIERHKLYVSNLPWKARAPNVKEFFANFNPLSANVIFDNGKAAGYGFVSFGTKEEAEAALTELDGKELMGRPVRLNWRESGDDKVEVAKADSEVEVVNIEGASIDHASTDGGEDKQE